MYPRSLWRTFSGKTAAPVFNHHSQVRNEVLGDQETALARATFSIRIPNHGTICGASAIPLSCYEQQKNQVNASVSFKLQDAFRKGA